MMRQNDGMEHVLLPNPVYAFKDVQQHYIFMYTVPSTNYGWKDLFYGFFIVTQTVPDSYSHVPNLSFHRNAAL